MIKPLLILSAICFAANGCQDSSKNENPESVTEKQSKTLSFLIELNGVKHPLSKEFSLKLIEIISRKPKVGDRGGLAVAPRYEIEIGGKIFDYYGFITDEFNTGWWNSWEDPSLHELWEYMNSHGDLNNIDKFIPSK